MMNKNHAKQILLIAIIIFFVGSLLWANFKFSNQNNAGADFLNRWLPGRLVMFDDFSNPYSQDITQQIQYFRYGRLAIEGEMQGLFAYPYYTLFIMMPFILIKNYTLARSLWMTLLQVSHILIVFITLKIVKFSPKILTFILFLTIALISSFLIQPIIEGNPSSLAALFIVFVLFFLSKNKDSVAGIFLALATFKPQMTLFFFILVYLWAFSNRRWRVIIYSMVGVIILFGVSFVFQSDWLIEFIKQLILYSDYATPNNPTAILARSFPQINHLLGVSLSVVSILLILYEWICVYGKGYSHFLWTACFTFCILPISGIVFGNRNFVALLPGFLICFSIFFKEHPERGKLWNLLLFLALILSWSAIIIPLTPLAGISFFSFNNYLPLSILLLIGMYIVRPKMISQFTTTQNTTQLTQ